MKYSVSSELLDKLCAYLATQPYQEVAGILSTIVQIVQEQQNSAKIESPKAEQSKVEQPKVETKP